MHGRASPIPTRSDCNQVLRDTSYVLTKLDWLREQGIWPNGLRYLWTDAFGVVLYVFLS